MALKGKSKKSKNLLQSFGYAFEGILYALKTVKNLRIHLAFTTLVIIGGIFFELSPSEFFICLLFVALVISLELVNTAIEEAVDLASPELNPIAKRSKDVSASAVLFSAFIAFIVGVSIFLPKVVEFVRSLV